MKTIHEIQGMQLEWYLIDVIKRKPNGRHFKWSPWLDMKTSEDLLTRAQYSFEPQSWLRSTTPGIDNYFSQTNTKKLSLVRGSNKVLSGHD